jgi:hypothetical protein
VTVKPADYIGPACACGQCVQAGVDRRLQRRDPDTGAWLHGYALKRWYESADGCLAAIKDLAKKKAMP